MKDNVVIIGGDHHNTLGLVRSYGIRGIKPTVILIGQTVDGFVTKSRFVGDCFRCQSSHEAVAKLISCFSHSNQMVVVQTSSDAAAAALDSALGELPTLFRVPNAGGELTHLMNKDEMCRLAISVGLNVPWYKTIRTNDIKARGNTDIVYPCITKAVSSLEGGKADTAVCQNEAEFLAFLNSGFRCPVLLIEQFINKDFEFQLFGLSLDAGKEIIIPGHSHIHRPGIQNEYYFPYIENDASFFETLDKTRAFIKAAKYSGLFSMEFLRGKDGKDYFLEINFRNDGNAICVTDAGFNLPYIWYLYHTGGDYHLELQKSTFKSVEFCPDVIYFYHMLKGELSFYDWYITRKRCNSFTNYYKGDNKPYWINLFNNLVGFIKTIIKRLFA